MTLTTPPNKGGGLNQSQQDEIQEIVDDIVETIPLKKLIDFADMDESDAEALIRFKYCNAFLEILFKVGSLYFVKSVG